MYFCPLFLLVLEWEQTHLVSSVRSGKPVPISNVYGHKQRLKKAWIPASQRTSLSHILLAQSQCSIVFKLMTRCSKISWFFSGEQIFRLRQIIVLRDTDKSRYFAITMFNNIIVLSFDHLVCLLMNIFGKRSSLPFFTQEWSQGREKCGFIYAWA